MASNPTTPPSILVDSSVLFAAAVSSKGFARDLVLGAASDRYRLVVSEYVLTETERNLATKSPTALPGFRVLIATGLFRVVDPTATQVRRLHSIVVAKDAAIVAAAVAAKAAFIASYDRKHLLSQASVIQAQTGIRVDTPDNILHPILTTGNG